jgi:ankyrin repeat protein
MSEQTPESASGSLSLPDAPNLDWLRKQAKRRLDELRQSNPEAKLTDAQLAIARQYGFPSWRALKAHIDSLTLDGQLFAAAKSGDVAVLTGMLDRHPDKLGVRNQPYEHTLLHVAASAGQLAVVDLLLRRGLDVNAREKGDNTYAMHWAAAGGYVDVVRRLADAGGDVVGRGDDHELEVIGWATCWDGTDDASHHAVVQVLLEHGAHHHIFSAIALNLGDEVRRIVAADPSALNQRMSRNENNQLPLQFAVRMNRREMVDLLLELGADPLAVDASGEPAALYATVPGVDRRVMEAIRAMTAAELESAARGDRPARAGAMDLVAALALQDLDTAEHLVRANPGLIERGQAKGGALHMLAKRGDVPAVQWLLDQGANPDSLWLHWEAEVTSLHLAILGGHADVVRVLLRAGADPTIRDSKFGSDATGWAEHFGRPDIVEVIKARSR